MALASVTAVAALGTRAATSLHIDQRYIVERERAVAENAFGQRELDGGLAFQQPVQGNVEFVLVDVAEPERFAQA